MKDADDEGVLGPVSHYGQIHCLERLCVTQPGTYPLGTYLPKTSIPAGCRDPQTDSSYRKYTVVRAGFEALVAYNERKFENGTWPSFGSEF